VKSPSLPLWCQSIDDRPIPVRDMLRGDVEVCVNEDAQDRLLVPSSPVAVASDALDSSLSMLLLSNSSEQTITTVSLKSSVSAASSRQQLTTAAADDVAALRPFDISVNAQSVAHVCK